MRFQRDVANDEADVMLSGKLFHEIGPADENDRPPSHQQRRGVMGRTLEEQCTGLETNCGRQVGAS